MVKKQPKYYYHNNSRNCFVVSKKIKGKSNFFGYFKTEKAAKLAVELYKKYGWKKENNWKVKHEVKETIQGENIT